MEGKNTIRLSQSHQCRSKYDETDYRKLSSKWIRMEVALATMCVMPVNRRTAGRPTDKLETLSKKGLLPTQKIKHAHVKHTRDAAVVVNKEKRGRRNEGCMSGGITFLCKVQNYHGCCQQDR